MHRNTVCTVISVGIWNMQEIDYEGSIVLKKGLACQEAAWSRQNIVQSQIWQVKVVLDVCQSCKLFEAIKTMYKLVDMENCCGRFQVA